MKPIEKALVALTKKRPPPTGLTVGMRAEELRRLARRILLNEEDSL